MIRTRKCGSCDALQLEADRRRVMGFNYEVHNASAYRWNTSATSALP